MKEGERAALMVGLLGVILIAVYILSPIEGIVWPFVVGWFFIISAILSWRNA
jgi:hypothetical protein